MTTSPITGALKRVWSRISVGTMGRICARNRQHAYDLVVRAFKASGMTQADLARRAGMSPEVVNRILKRPRNLELDTLSKLHFALTGAAITFAPEFPSVAKQKVVTDNTLRILQVASPQPQLRAA
jgi:transcriptional regulator with XRE-family HTH domain